MVGGSLIVLTTGHVIGLSVGILMGVIAARPMAARQVALAAIGGAYAVVVAHFTLLPLVVGPSFGIPGSEAVRVALELRPFFLPGSAPLVAYQAFANIVLMAPLGVWVATDGRPSIGRAAFVGVAASATIEGSQLLANLVGLARPFRIVDVNDLLFNTSGALVGYASARLWKMFGQSALRRGWTGAPHSHRYTSERFGSADRKLNRLSRAGRRLGEMARPTILPRVIAGAIAVTLFGTTIWSLVPKSRNALDMIPPPAPSFPLAYDGASTWRRVDDFAIPGAPSRYEKPVDLETALFEHLTQRWALADGYQLDGDIGQADSVVVATLTGGPDKSVVGKQYRLYVHYDWSGWWLDGRADVRFFCHGRSGACA